MADKDQDPLSAKLATLSVDDDDPDGDDDDDGLTLDEIVTRIKEGRIKNIVTMAGAGISTSAGIPDFRSKATGLYAIIAEKYPDLPCAEAIFDIGYFRKNPQPFFKLAKDLLPAKGDGDFQPTRCHRFIKKLHDRKLLLR